MSTCEADGLTLDTVEFVTADGTRKEFSPLRSLNWHSFKLFRAAFKLVSVFLDYWSLLTLISFFVSWLVFRYGRRVLNGKKVKGINKFE